MSYEADYRQLVIDILANGEKREGRNGATRALFGKTLVVDMQEGFPLLKGRNLYYKGVLGELAAMLKQPKTIKDFEAQGCNYWGLWAQKDGSINVDYGNKWLDWDGHNQLQTVLDTIVDNPHDRRMIVTGWDPANLDNLDLPCCHYAYQWYVRDGEYLDMLWHQRSVDTMIGLPSDVIFAGAWLIAMSAETKLLPGKITFTLGDTHIYEEHIAPARLYLKASRNADKLQVMWQYKPLEDARVVDFTPDMLRIRDYYPSGHIQFELKA